MLLGAAGRPALPPVTVLDKVQDKPQPLLVEADSTDKPHKGVKRTILFHPRPVRTWRAELLTNHCPRLSATGQRERNSVPRL